MDDEQPTWLTTLQVAELFQVTEETVRRWIRSGDLPVLQLGTGRSGYRIRREDVDRFIQDRYGALKSRGA